MDDFCDFHIYRRNFACIISKDSNALEFKAQKEQARKDFAKRFDTKTFSDVTFVVSGVEFRAHKCILSARYESFYSMFRNCKEAEQNQITIPDIEPAVFKIILQFTYKGELSDWKNMSLT